MNKLALGPWAALLSASLALADAPVAQYVFPAGGRRGTAVGFRVGGLFLHDGAELVMTGPGVRASPRLTPTRTVWFEGPVLPLPDSQRPEDYPKDFAGRVEIAADAPRGLRTWHVITSQGVAPGLKFEIGDLPEIVEDEIDGDPVPVGVSLPVTVNGRVFPREDVDVWTFAAKRGELISADLRAARLGSPLEARLEVVGPDGNRLAESAPADVEPSLDFTAPADGTYSIRVHDHRFHGGQAFVYRLSLTSGPRVRRVFPLGGRRGTTTEFVPAGPGVDATPIAVAIPADAAGGWVHDFGGGATLSPDLDDLPEHRSDRRAGADPPVALPAVLNGRIAAPGAADEWPVAMSKGPAWELDLRAGRLGSPLDGRIAVLDAAGKTLAAAEADAKSIDPRLTFRAPADGVFRIRVSDRFRSRGGPAFAYRLRIAPAPPPDFRLTLPTDALSLVRGGETKLRVTVERSGGFQEPIILEAEGLPAGVTLAPVTVTAKQATADLKFATAPIAPVRWSRVVIRGRAAAGGGLVRAAEPLPAAVAVPCPFKIVPAYEMHWAPRGSVLARRYRLERGGFDGPVQVMLCDRQARHLQGVTGPVITVPAGRDEFEYAAALAPWMEIGRTSRTCIMAVGTVRDPDGTEHVVSFGSTHNDHQIIAVVEPGRLGLELDRPAIAASPGATVRIPVRIARGRGVTGPVRIEVLWPGHVRGASAEPLVVAAEAASGELTARFAEALQGPWNAPAIVRATVSSPTGPVTAEARLEVRAAER